MNIIFFIPDFFRAYDFDENWMLFLQCLRTRAVDGLRIFLQFSWPPYEVGKANVLSPYRQKGFWNPYGDERYVPFYSQLDFRKELNLDPQWLSKNEELAYWLRRHWPDVKLILTLHDYCSIKQPGLNKYFYPFLSSSPDRRIDDPKYNRYAGGFWGMDEMTGGNSVQFLHEKYIKAVKNIYYDLDVYLEFCNEDEVQGWDDSYASKYYAWLRKIIGEKFIISGRYANYQPGTIYSEHGTIFPKDKKLPSHPSLTLISGDGASGGSGSPDASGRRGLGLVETEFLVPWLFENEFWGYEYMDRGIWGDDNNRAKLELVNLTDLEYFMKKVEDFRHPKPKKTVISVCKESGLLPLNTCPEVVEEVFDIGDEPREICYYHEIIETDFCLKTGKLANYFCPKTYRKRLFVKDLPQECDFHKETFWYWIKKGNFKRALLFLKILLKRRLI